LSGENSRATPSASMMNAPNWPGGESGLISGTSPTQAWPFHLMPTRVGSHGLRAGPNALCSVEEPIANSSRFVLPTIA